MATLILLLILSAFALALALAGFAKTIGEICDSLPKDRL